MKELDRSYEKPSTSNMVFLMMNLFNIKISSELSSVGVKIFDEVKYFLNFLLISKNI